MNHGVVEFLYSEEIKYEEVEEDSSNHKGHGGNYAGKYEQPRCCPFCDQGYFKSVTVFSKNPYFPLNFQ